ncbi:hypothetical protein KM043_003959 [Ampulex compressa]|nr:hypothetical protein KM043_003959 [Ampulex compressa]
MDRSVGHVDDVSLCARPSKRRDPSPCSSDALNQPSCFVREGGARLQSRAPEESEPRLSATGADGDKSPFEFLRWFDVRVPRDYYHRDLGNTAGRNFEGINPVSRARRVLGVESFAGYDRNSFPPGASNGAVGILGSELDIRVDEKGKFCFDNVLADGAIPDGASKKQFLETGLRAACVASALCCRYRALYVNRYCALSKTSGSYWNPPCPAGKPFPGEWTSKEPSWREFV